MENKILNSLLDAQLNGSLANEKGDPDTKLRPLLFPMYLLSSVDDKNRNAPLELAFVLYPGVTLKLVDDIANANARANANTIIEKTRKASTLIDVLEYKEATLELAYGYMNGDNYDKFNRLVNHCVDSYISKRTKTAEVAKVTSEA